MKKEYLKRGFGYLILIIIVIGISLLFNNGIDKQLEEITPIQEQDEVPLQNAVGEEVIAKTNSKKNTKKKTTKKKTTKKVVNKNIIKKSKPRKVSLNVNGSKAEMQQYAHELVLSYGWSEYDFQCLVKIVNHESGWNPNVVNKSSKACGLAQALPCSKMASAGADYRTNYKTQLKWLMGYIKGRYKTPSKAWSFWQKHHWY